MNKKTFSLLDLLSLESEINGLVNPTTKEVLINGFMNQNLPIILKYDLLDLSEFLTNEKKKVESLRNELIKKYGEADADGNISINAFADEERKVINEKFVEFEKEYNELLMQTVEVEYPDITRDDLKDCGKSSENYRQLFLLIKK